ncbi:alpha/beta hydrolase [Glaciihabitans sp. dw_435]|uniref:alpha/beta hydrolase n=1 Tax=Glaciihabitans sp. dw_435 TaxID=2720081 RepID=UPI001BD2BF1B|nr:alpha/beta hydrolase [Glaciihabitans sp. dw_435]
MASNEKTLKFVTTGRGVAGTIGILGAAGAAAFALSSPWASAMAIRGVFTRGAQATSREMEPYAPTSGIDAGLNLSYGGGRPNTHFDVFTPTGGQEPLATIVWIHGGSWLSGNKNDLRPYLRKLAGRGYTVIGVDYPLAPEHRYPATLVELNAALGYFVDHAAELRIDPTRLILAGDSAGAQLASQLATAITSPDYARAVKLYPRVAPEQVAATVLHCGIFDLDAVAEMPGILNWGFRASLWAYLGVKDWEPTPEAQAMSTITHVTEHFPPTFISGGNADLLTSSQSQPMARRLTELGVDVTELFWAKAYERNLPHEYQFHLDFADSRDAFETTVAFLDEKTAVPVVA